MTLEEYTNLDKTSFCYWVEATTADLGSIWGGSAYKFGIFKRRNLESTTSKDSLITDGEYSWAKKYGDTKEIAFQKIKTPPLVRESFHRSCANPFAFGKKQTRSCTKQNSAYLNHISKVTNSIPPSDRMTKKVEA